MNKILFIFVAVLSFCFSFTASYAQTTGTLILNDKYDQHYLSPYLTIHEGIEEAQEVREVIMGHNKQKKMFSLSNSVYLFPPEQSTVWISFKLKNSSKTEEWVFDFGSVLSGRFGFFKNFEIYQYNLTTGEIVEIEYTGDQVIPISVVKGSASQILVKMTKLPAAPAAISMRFLKAGKWVESYNSATGHTLYVMTLLSVVFIWIGFSIFKINGMAFVFSGIFATFLAFYLMQNAVTASSNWLLYAAAYPSLSIILGLLSVVSSRMFWRLSGRSEVLDKLYMMWMGGVVIIPIIGTILFTSNTMMYFLACFVPTILSIVLIGMASVYRSQTEDNGNIFYMLGWFVLLIGVCVTILALTTIIQPISFFINAFYYSLIPQAVFFIFAIRLHLNQNVDVFAYSRTLQIEEDDSLNRLRETKENTEQQRLLKVIEQERKVMNELRKSEARRAEEMRVSKEAADEANRAKSAFLAVVSHEIRTPMTGIMGMVRLLLNTNLSKDQKEHAQTIQDSSDAMLALLNDILDFEKIEQGKMTFENISFDLPRLFRGIINLMNGHASQKGISLDIKLGDNLPRYVRGDMTRLRQVLLNLIGNAIKFTDQGSVTVTAELIKASQEGEKAKYEIYFGVKDSGIGISEEAQQNLFNPFSQADSSISRKFGGTGLGLAISRGLVEGMGSTINISSHEGEGSTFFFTLSMEQGQGKEADRVEEENRKKYDVIEEKKDKELKILAVDDNKVNLSVIDGFLKDKPYDIDTAGSAEEAIYKMEQISYDVVLMDIELPGMRGDEATSKIRQRHDALRHIPIIALTGNVMPDDIDRYNEAGMNAVLPKPIDAQELQKTIIETVANKERAMASEAKDIQEEQVTADVFAPTPEVPSVFEEKEVTLPHPVEPPVEAPQILSAPENVFNSETLDTLKSHLSEDDIKEMVLDVVEKSADIIDELQQALNDEDTDQLKAKSHELKGMAGNFGLMGLSRIATDIESKCLTEPFIVLSALINDLPGTLGQSKQEIDNWLSENF